MTLTLQNVDKNIYEIIKNLATIQPNLKVQIDDEAEFELNETTIKILADTNNKATKYNSYDEFEKEIMQELKNEA